MTRSAGRARNSVKNQVSGSDPPVRASIRSARGKETKSRRGDKA